MIDLLERAAIESPDRVAVRTSEAQRTYAELLDDARRVAAALDERGLRRFAVVEADAARILALLAGAALVGAEACQYPPDIDAGQFREQTQGLGHEHVVTRREDLADGFTVHETGGLFEGAPYDGAAGEAQPLLIRTTGTTGAPKAARHDWRILARTVSGRTSAPDERWLLAYGPQQFAGIQVLIHVVAVQATLIAPFPRQPRDGLTALVDDGVTALSATPTYWRFLLTEARSRGIELPALRQVTLGGEAAPPDLLEELAAAFPQARVSHVYASTEFGSVASVRDGQPGFAVSQLFPANPDGTMKVVDGELWVRAGAGMLGYVGDESASNDGAEWRPTGDLAEIVGERMFFRGRGSEVINVGGVKVAPLPVEERVLGVDGVALARVFGRANRLTGAIVAAEVVLDDGADEDAVRTGIREAMADLPRAWHPRSITVVDTIETQGNKTIRRTEA